MTPSRRACRPTSRRLIGDTSVLFALPRKWAE